MVHRSDNAGSRPARGEPLEAQAQVGHQQDADPEARQAESRDGPGPDDLILPGAPVVRRHGGERNPDDQCQHTASPMSSAVTARCDATIEVTLVPVRKEYPRFPCASCPRKVKYCEPGGRESRSWRRPAAMLAAVA